MESGAQPGRFIQHARDLVERQPAVARVADDDAVDPGGGQFRGGAAQRDQF